MFVELATAIENAGGSVTAPERLNEVQDIKELIGVVNRRGASRRPSKSRTDPRKVGRGNLCSFSCAQSRKQSGRCVTEGFLQSVSANTVRRPVQHSASYKLHSRSQSLFAPRYGPDKDGSRRKSEMISSRLPAADYFFDTKYKRAVMENFTNLVPMERTGSLRQSLRHARSFLDRGYNALIFPEGTRSVTGEMADFKPVIGYLALHARVGILPMYLHGTYQAMPKGSTLIKSRDVGARIGRFISYEEVEELTKGMARSEAYRLIAALVRHEVDRLRTRSRDSFDAKGLRKLWKAERRGTSD